MTSTAPDPFFRRDRTIVLAALAIISAAAWVYVIWLAAHMPVAEMDMPGMARPTVASWTTVDGLFMFAMWVVMMVGMMTPSVAPMVMIHARVARQADAQGKPFAATGWFVGGYLLAWTGFALVATLAQWGLESAALLTPMMAAASHTFGGLLLLGAGLYQWTPLKDACLSQCQAPLVFIQRHGGFRRDFRGSLLLGARHGLYCIGCCWALMGLLFVGGIMNLLWIAAIAAFVLIEKILPLGRWVCRSAGAALILAGLWMLA